MSLKREPTQRLLRAEEVGHRFNVSERTVWRLVSGGELPKPVKIGRCCRWRKVDVDAYIDALGQS